MFEVHRALVIANPAAAGGRVARQWTRIVREIKAGLGDVEIVRTEAPRHATVLAREAVWAGKDIILSLGGDGTHSEVVGGIVKDRPKPESITVGVIPVGTGGDFRRMLIGGGRLREQIDVIATAPARPIDVGLLKYTDDLGEVSEHIFLNETSVGMSSLICTLVNDSTKLFGGRFTYYLNTLRALARFAPAEVRVRIDGIDVGEFRTSTVMISNGQYAGGGMQFAPQARMSDGLLDVTVIQQGTTSQMVAMSPSMYNGRIADAPLVKCFRGFSVSLQLVTSGEFGVEADGELTGALPLEATIVNHAVRMIGVRDDVL